MARVGLSTPQHLRAGLLERRLEDGGVLRVGSHEQVAALDATPPPRNTQEAGVFVSTYNLTSTVLGAGILSIPFAISKAGLGMGILLLLATAVASIKSCGLLLSSYLRIGKASYGDLALVLFGPAASTTIRWIIIVLNIGAASGYILVVKDLLPASLCQIFGPSSWFCGGDVRKWQVTGLVVALIIFPLCTLKNLSSLRMTSLLAFLFAMFLTFAITFRSLEHGEYCDIRMFPSEWFDVFQTIPVFSFSFVTHLNVLPVYGQLESRTPALMRTVFRNAICFALFLYILVGAFGYLRFTCTGGAPDNILAFTGGFGRDDLLIAAARIAEALTCTLALPLIQHPTRTALHSLFFHSEQEENEEAFDECEEEYQNYYQRQGMGSSDGFFLGSIEEENGSEVASSEATVTRDTVTSLLAQESGHVAVTPTRKMCSRRFERVFLAAIIMTTSFSVAVIVPNISTVFGLMGSTCCSLICFVLPGLFYLQSTKQVLADFPFDRPYSVKDLEKLKRVVYQRRLSWVLIVFGITVGILGTIATVTAMK